LKTWSLCRHEIDLLWTLHGKNQTEHTGTTVGAKRHSFLMLILTFITFTASFVNIKLGIFFLHEPRNVFSAAGCERLKETSPIVVHWIALHGAEVSDYKPVPRDRPSLDFIVNFYQVPQIKWLYCTSYEAQTTFFHIL